MKLLLEGILARVQRDLKVIICHYLFNGNHPHMLIVARDSQQCIEFYGQVQKQLTDAIKRLLNLEHLSLFQKNSTSVIPYGDMEGAMERIAYLYANPAAANLVDSIEHYPGVSTWEAFKQAPHTLNAQYEKQCMWIRQPMIPKLPSRSLTSQQDKHFSQRLLQSAKKRHPLLIQPNEWMKVFGVAEDEVQSINDAIIERLGEKEAQARSKRLEKGWKVKGPSRLAREALSLDYRPQKQSRRIYVYAADKNIRIAMIEAHKDFSNQCDECYLRWKQGDYTVDWPPGAFLPAMPPRANYFCEQYDAL